MKSQDRSIRRNKFYRFDPNILINGEQTESSSRSSTPNSYRKIEPEIMRRLMNDGKGQPPFKIHTRNSTYYLEEIVLVYSFKTF
ncbi:unnamed protein product [Rhizophagus irregularis]|nr:unnamed protein product [Rhizophagus irregularis]